MKIFNFEQREIKTSFSTFYSTVEIGIREFSATYTFAYAYVCLLRYVFNSIGNF